MKHLLLFVVPSFIFGLTIYSPKAAPALPLLRLTNVVNVVFYQDLTTEIIPRIARREEALYIIPANIAAKLYTRTPDLRLVGVTSIGMLSLLTTNQRATNWSDLHARQVHIGAPGSSPDTISRVLFRAHNITPEIVYSDSPQIAQSMIAGRVENAVLPEPLASLVLFRNPAARILKSYREAWEKFYTTRSGVPQTVIVSFAGFLQRNNAALVKFFQAYQQEVRWVHANPREASTLGVVGLGITVPPSVIEQSIPRMGLTYIPARIARQDILLYLRELMRIEPDAVGRIPDDAFFAW